MGKNLDEGVALLQDLSKEELIAIIVDDAKNWLAHDGLWFQAVDQKYGMETAIEIDKAAWEKFTVVEAKRIMSRLGIEPGGGIPALIECLKHPGPVIRSNAIKSILLAPSLPSRSILNDRS